MELLTIVVTTWVALSLALALVVGPLLRGFDRLSFRHEGRPASADDDRVRRRSRQGRSWAPVTLAGT